MFFFKIGDIILLLNIIVIVYTKGLLDFSHDKDEELQIQAGALSSINGIIPFSYQSLKICDMDKITKAEDTLGEILTGEKKFFTGYTLNIAKNALCEQLCYNKFWFKRF
jgi:hypothetical protein